MSRDFNTALIAMIVSGIGFLFVLISPGRDAFANWTILFGLFGNWVLHTVNSILLRLRNIKDFQGLLFSIKIINFAFISLAIVGMLIGNFLATWSPFWFMPFGYYIFISFTIIYTLNYDLEQLYLVYKLRIKVNENETSKIQEIVN